MTFAITTLLILSSFNVYYFLLKFYALIVSPLKYILYSSALYPCKKNAERVSKYRPHLNSIDLMGLTFPVSIHRIARFEKNNPTISINVYALGKDDREIIPKFVTKCGAREKHVDLLLLSSKTGDNFHYIWI
jgi:hypothetical protein